MLILTARETEAFAHAILNPPRPGFTLREAAREYREKRPSGELLGMAAIEKAFQAS
jgi:hypothetical protein